MRQHDNIQYFLSRFKSASPRLGLSVTAAVDPMPLAGRDDQQGLNWAIALPSRVSITIELINA